MKTDNLETKKSSVYFIIGNTLLAIIIFSAVIYQSYSNRQQIVDENFSRVSHLSSVIEETIQTSFGAIEIVLDQLAFQVKSKNSAKKISDAELNQLRSEIEKINTVNLNWADENGILQWNSEEKTVPLEKAKINISDRAYFKYFKENNTNEILISEPLYGKIRKKWVIVISKGLRGNDGKFLGIAWCSISTDYFDELKNKLNISDRDIFTVASGNPAKYIYRSSNSEVAGKVFVGPIEAANVVNRSLHNGVYQVTSPIDHIKRISAFTWVNKLPILVVVGRDFDAALNPWKKEVITTIVLTFFGIFLSIALSINFVKTNNQYRQYQQQLVSSSKLVALGEMSGSVAHEINNPLMIINGHIEKIHRILKRNPENISEIENSLNKIKSTTDRISNIVIGLRKISIQKEGGFMKLAIDPIISEATLMAHERFRSSGIELFVELDCENIQIGVNESQLLQVMVNLLNNSYDAIYDKPNPWLKVQSVVQNKIVKIIFTDSGPGIPAEIAENLMSPFFTTKGIGKGTGLGLSISKEIVETHGGRLLYNFSHSNTQFIVELPIGNEKT